MLPLLSLNGLLTDMMLLRQSEPQGRSRVAIRGRPNVDTADCDTCSADDAPLKGEEGEHQICDRGCGQSE